MTVMVAVASGSDEFSVAIVVIGVSVIMLDKPCGSAAGTMVEMGAGLSGVMSIGSCSSCGSGSDNGTTTGCCTTGGCCGCIGTITWGITCGVWRMGVAVS